MCVVGLFCPAWRFPNPSFFRFQKRPSRIVCRVSPGECALSGGITWLVWKSKLEIRMHCTAGGLEGHDCVPGK